MDALDPSIERLFEESFPVIRANCARILGDGQEAEDVAQETFLRLCSAPPTEREPDARLGWIYRTSTRLAIDLWRHRKLGVEVAGPAALDAPSSASAPDQVVIARGLLRRMAGRVPPDELEAAVLARVDGLTQPEIAEVTARSERSVRRLLARFEERMVRFTREHSS